MAIKASVNIKYDFNDQSMIDNYYATSSHSELIRNVLFGVLGKNNINAHIAYGPYGSGKSFVASILLGILTKSYDLKTINKLINKYSSVDQEISKALTSEIKKTSKYIPVILNGFEGDFNDSLANAVSKALTANGVDDIAIPGVKSEINKIISMWNKEYPNTMNQFSLLLLEQQITIEKFISEIESNNQAYIKLFSEIYKTITSGSDFRVSNNVSPTSLVEGVCIKLRERNMGLFIVYDEFGRYLQSLENENLNIFMQEMQNMAELANNGLSNLSVIFIAHKPISHYFSLLSKDLRAEFSKVEKRFGIYEIKSDYITFFNITTRFIKELQLKNTASLDHDFLTNARKYNVFSGIISDTELEETILNKLYPLHPITVFLLPRISSIFGQNERTLFTFLNDNSDNGILGHIRNSNDYYYPNKLVDYFFYKIDLSYIEDSIEYSIYRKNINKIASLVSKKHIRDAEKIYKFMLVWKITKGTSVVKLNDKFVSYSLGISSDIVTQILDELSTNKMIRYNNIHDQWEIFEGSALKIETTLKEIALFNRSSDSDLLKILNDNNPYRYIYANDHNSKNEITRFAEILFVFDEGQMEHYKNPADLHILMGFVDTNIIEKKDSISIIDIPFFKIRKILERVHAITILSKSQTYMLNYPNLDIELEYELHKSLRHLDQVYSSIFSKKTKIHIDNRHHSFENINQFSNELSKYFDNKFNKTIVIVNDQVNMFQLTRIQNNALVTVLDELLKKGSKKLDDVFNGSKPADLVYFTIIHNISNIKNNKEYIRDINIELEKKLDENPSGNLSDLIFFICKEPYGIRPRVAILIVMSLLINKMKDFLLFMNDSYIPSIDTETLFDILLSNKYVLQYTYSRFDNKHRNYLEKIEHIFGDSSTNVKNKSLSIRVCSGMYNWYLSLPVITQQYEGLGYMEKNFLQIIAYSRTNPEKSVVDLMNFMSDPDDIIACKKIIEGNYNKYLVNLEKDIFNSLGINDKIKWVENLSEINKKTNILAQSIIQKRSIIDQFAPSIENLDPTRWTKSSFLSLKKVILDDCSVSFDNIDYNKIIINGKEKAVQNIELSNKAKLMLDNIDNLIIATKRYITHSEIEKIIIELLEKYVK